MALVVIEIRVMGNGVFRKECDDFCWAILDCFDVLEGDLESSITSG